MLAAINGLACALAVEARLPEPAELKDALTPPLSHQWKDALPTVTQFMTDANAACKPVSELLGKV